MSDTYVEVIAELVRIAEDRAVRSLSESRGMGARLAEGVSQELNPGVAQNGGYDDEGDWQGGFQLGVSVFGDTF